MENESEILASLVPKLAEQNRSAKILAFGVRCGEHGRSLSFVHGAGPRFTKALVQDFNSLLAEHEPGFLFDLANPQRSQRNVALVLPPILTVPRSGLMLRKENGRRIRIVPAQGLSRRPARDRWSRLFRSAGIENDFLVRALICDGPVLLAWVGMFLPKTPSRTEEQLLTSFIPVLQKRLRIERALGPLGLQSDALSTVLEKISRPAFLLTGVGGIVHANSSGQKLADTDPVQLDEQLQSSMRFDAHSAFELTRMSCTGLSPHYLAVQRQSNGLDASRLKAAGAVWQLTTRETAVLSKMVYGESNKRIALALDCSESNVELHITRLLRKAGVGTRTAVIAKFWSDCHSKLAA